VIFVDSGAFLARYLSRDQYHERAIAAWRSLEQLRWRCCTSNFVLDETITLLGRWSSHEFASERARGLLTSRSLDILRPEVADELEALELFEKMADQAVSFTDCVSFALMRRRRIERAFSFDRHFALAGFTLWVGDD
jgi:predicted nucleic acid-binding protein